ncbi:conserved hypothetical protein [Frankia canadensis]|uniref:UGSC-like domain-containing protein n=1 Tax=Frankia canadensis TaxID=1836972 RepID=A0A2I2KIV4_9ACTN|nr:hypothetical protein [Frankia canadensis]SNQ45599.1 conserved hypothetical protein [Frankia canadensis]SOU52889.1 conserved hypothetical protein [Frankia canadensis]
MTTTAPPDINQAIEHLRDLVRGDGADLRLIDVNDQAHTIELALDITDVECAECLLPPNRLREVLTASLAQRGLTSHRVVLRDPRSTATTESAAPARITVLDPTAAVDAGDGDPGPDAGPLAGRTIAIRIDVLWQSWDWVVDEWTRLLGEGGATARAWRRAQGLSGAEGAAADDAYDRLLAEADVAIVGLGNCGSCTSWTIRDAVRPARRGLPTVGVVTAQFTALGTMLATQYGRPGLRLLTLPFPLQTRPEDEVRQIARDAFPALLETLGATL